MNILQRNMSITKKMKLIMMAVSTIAVVSAGLASIYLSYLNYRANLSKDLQGLAYVVGRNCQVALKFNLPEDTAQSLTAFDVRPSIVFACIFDSGGKLFSVYDPSGKHAMKFEQLLKGTGSHQEEKHEGYLHVIVPLMINQEKIGTMIIADDMSSITAAMKKDIIILLLVMLIAMGIAHLLTNRLQGLITGPIIELSRIANRITQERNYGLRAEKQSNDEAGLLIDSFNQLISSIHKHEAELRSAYATVWDREKELGAKNEELLAQEQVLRSTNLELRASLQQLKASESTLLASEEALKESRAYNRILFDDSHIPLIVMDPDTGQYTDCNAAAVRIYRYASRDEVLGKTPIDVSAPTQYDGSDSRTAAQERMKECLKQGAIVFEWRQQRPDGEIWDAEVRLMRFQYQDKTLVQFSLQDITERRRLEEHLRQSQKMEAIGTLAGGIAHDFNNILAAIIGYTEIAYCETGASEKSRGMLANVLKASERAKELVKQILAFSRMGGEEKKPVLIRDIIKEGLKLLRASIPATVEMRSSIESDAVIMADPTQIHQVLMNLCTNAAHAMEDRGGVIDVTLQDILFEAEADERNPDLKKGDYVRLTVGDTGKGIDPSLLNKIFEPFFTTKEKGKGTGMGLSVVHGIVKSHGGAINVYSETGKGSTFSVYLPVIPQAAPLQETVDEALPGGTERILFVDDEEMLVSIGLSYLESLGYTVSAFASGSDGLAAFKDDPGGYDLIITDYTMPHMTGYDLAKQVLVIRSDMPIILCTGFTESFSTEMAKKVGIREFLLKPLNKTTLAQVVRRTLDSVKALT